MDATDAPLVDEPQVRTDKIKPLAVRDWIWRSWCAKLWWAGTILYWIGFALSFPLTALQAFYSTALAGYLNVAFYPPVILMILGIGYIRAKIENGDWVITAADPPSHKPNRSVSGSLDPYTDPLDPRSGSLYIGSPEKLAELFGRKWP